MHDTSVELPKREGSLVTNRDFDFEAAWKLMPHLASLDEDERPEDPMEEIRENGEVVGEHEWDSGSVGAGAGSLVVYRYAGKFFAEDDVEAMGPFDTFAEAAEAVGLFRKTDATTGIWVAKGHKQPPG